MIINIRGTSGSGKSVLVKKVMAKYGLRLRYRQEGRKRPIGYVCQRKGPGRSLAVLGHYETACGGCDTIHSLDEIFELARTADLAGHDVLFEGLLVNSDRNRTIQLHEDGYDLTVITLSTSLELCLDSVKARREARKRVGEPKPLNPRNTAVKYSLTLVNHERFLQAGLSAHLIPRGEAETMVYTLLGLA